MEIFVCVAQSNRNLNDFILVWYTLHSQTTRYEMKNESREEEEEELDDLVFHSLFNVVEAW